MRSLIVLAAAAAFLVSPAWASGDTGTGKGTAAAPAEASPDRHASGMMTIHHKVANYDKWRPAFDEHKPMRDAAGLTDCHVRQEISDGNDVYVGCKMADEAKEFAASKDLKSAMKKAGSRASPTFTT
jgi:hypothetical protein